MRKGENKGGQIIANPRITILDNISVINDLARKGLARKKTKIHVLLSNFSFVI
jgi:hypothetical protein